MDVRDIIQYLIVEAIRLEYIVVYDFDVHTAVSFVRKVVHKLAKLRATDTISTVDSDVPLSFPSRHDYLESIGKLFVVALFGGLTVCIRRIGSIAAADYVMQLRGGEMSEVLVLCSHGIKTRTKSCDKTWAGSSGVPGKHNTSGV